MLKSNKPSVGLVATLLCALMGCDLSVSNPGPVADTALDEAVAHQAVVNGMGRALSRAVGFVAYTGGIVTREIVAAGLRNPSTLGVSLKQSVGILDPGLDENNDHWRYAQQARWVAEDGVRRIRDAIGPEFASSVLGAQALVYAGFANRLLGENMCSAVIDGGPVLPRSDYFARAEAAFTEAIGVAEAAGDAELGRAARAGRASVRVWLEDWSGAVADAQQIPQAFAYRAIYSNIEQDQYNRIFAANVTSARAHSVVGTFFEPYYRATNDPRTPWKTNPAFPTGSAGVLWYFQTKYDRQGSPINLVTGREMRLVIAEGLLRTGDWQQALAVINALRANVGMAPWTASDVGAAWTALARERGIELWLEGRLLGDIFRWKASSAPLTFSEMTGRDGCFPIGVSEIDANPNI